MAAAQQREVETRTLTRPSFQSTGPVAVVSGVVAAELWQLRAEAQPVAYGNDSAVHALMVRFVSSELARGRSPLSSWFPYLGLGSPQLSHYQPLGALLAGACGLLIGPNLAFSYSTWLLLATWPVSIYISARVFGLSRWTAAGAAAVCLFLSSASGIGYEQHAYLFDGYGVWAQLWAMWTLPLAWAYSWRAVQRREHRLPAVLFTALTICFHFETGYLALGAIAVWTIVPISRVGLRARSANALSVLGFTLLASAWVLAPLFLLRHWAATNEVLQGTALANGYGLPKMLGWLLSGRLFDYQRAPVVTLLVAAGASAAVRHARRSALGQGLLGIAVLSLLLAGGRTTFGPLIDVVPGSHDVFFRRFGMGVQLAGIYFAGIGAVAIWGLGLRVIYRTVPELVAPCRDRWLLLAARRFGVACLCLLLLAPAWYQLWSVDRRNAAAIAEQRTADGTAGKDVVALLQRAEGLGNGRVYAGMGSNWGANFKLGTVPMYLFVATQNVDEVAFTVATASLMSNPEHHLAENSSDFALFAVRYLLLPRTAAGPAGSDLIDERGPYALWRIPLNTYVQVVDTIGVIRENRSDIGRDSMPFLQSGLPALGMYDQVAFNGDSETDAATPSGAVSKTSPGSVVTESVDLVQGRAIAIVRSNGPGVALLHASFDPGWSATVDGVPRPTEMVSPAMVGVRVGPGAHRVSFSYVGFRYYAELLALVPAALVATAWLDRRRGRDKRRCGPNSRPPRPAI